MERNVVERHMGDLKDSFLYFLNIRSLRCHHDQLVIDINQLEQKPLIIALCETWLCDNDYLNLYHLDGYHPLISKHRKYQRGGECAFYVRDDVNFQLNNIEVNFECINISIVYKSVKTNISVVYKPPQSKNEVFLNHFENYLLYLNALKTNFLVCGDFNIDTLDCKPISNSYITLIKSCGAHILNRDPTRITPTSSKCIDHLIANFDANVKTLDSTISDHFPIILSGYVNVDPQENQDYCYRNLKNLYRDDKIYKYLFLLENKLSIFYKLSDPNKKLCLLVESIVSSIYRFAPLEKSKSQKQSWVTDSTKKILKNRNRLFSKWVQNPTELIKLKYSQARNLATKLIRNEKRFYYDKKVGNSRNSKTLFQAFYEFCKGNSKNMKFLAADVFNEFFASIGEKLRNPEFDYKEALGYVDRIEKSIVFYEITRKENENAIYMLKNKGSNGHDGINNKIIKLSLPVISVRICSLFNQCVKSGYFPQGLQKLFPYLREV